MARAPNSEVGHPQYARAVSTMKIPGMATAFLLGAGLQDELGGCDSFAPDEGVSVRGRRRW
jgi:hypothetical protein